MAEIQPLIRGDWASGSNVKGVRRKIAGENEMITGHRLELPCEVGDQQHRAHAAWRDE